MESGAKRLYELDEGGAAEKREKLHCGDRSVFQKQKLGRVRM